MALIIAVIVAINPKTPTDNKLYRTRDLGKEEKLTGWFNGF